MDGKVPYIDLTGENAEWSEELTEDGPIQGSQEGHGQESAERACAISATARARRRRPSPIASRMRTPGATKLHAYRSALAPPVLC